MRSLPAFYRGTAILVVVLTGVLFAARAGGTVASSRLNILLANADGSACEAPCVLGIRPGLMSLRQAEGILRNHPLLHSMDERACILTRGWCSFDLRGFNISGLVRSDNDGTVISVYLLLNDPHTLRLGDFINQFGPPGQMIPHFPCCAADQFVQRLESAAPRYGFWFYFPEKGLLVRDSARIENRSYRLQPDSPVFDFVVMQANQLPDSIRRGGDPWEQWSGFSSVNRYFALGREAGISD